MCTHRGSSVPATSPSKGVPALRPEPRHALNKTTRCGQEPRTYSDHMDRRTIRRIGGPYDRPTSYTKKTIASKTCRATAGGVVVVVVAVVVIVVVVVIIVVVVVVVVVVVLVLVIPCLNQKRALTARALTVRSFRLTRRCPRCSN